MKNKLLIILSAILLSACSSNNTIVQIESSNVETKKALPIKEIPESSLMSESPLSAENIDDYLFIEDVMYVDTRSPYMFYSEGHIAGFMNIPWYEAICQHEVSDNILFSMDKIRDKDGNVIANMGDVGSFSPNYEESVSLLYATFPKNKQIVFIASAGVESAYLMNLLIQYGYDANLLYNAGAVTNSLGKNVAYKDLKNTKHFVKPIDTFEVDAKISWGQLTKINTSK